MDKKDAIILGLLFILAFYIWTIPIKNSPLPYGEADAAWHFAIGDYISSTDRTLTRLPMFIEYWYYHINKILGIGALQYPPPPHVNYAIMQVLGGERVVPVFIYKSIASFLGVFSVYLLLRKLYGVFPAALAGFALIFSTRNLLIHLWGQQPLLTAFTFLPIIAYFYYQFIESLYEGRDFKTYLIITTLLLACQYFFHLSTTAPTLITIGFFTFLVIIRRGKLPFNKESFSRKMLPYFAAAILIILLLCLPFWNIYAGFVESQTKLGINNLHRLFQWSFNAKDVEGAYPAEFVSFKASYGLMLLPFLIIGLLVLLIRRNDKDLLILSALVGFYVSCHLDIILGSTLIGFEIRMLMLEPYLFFSIMAIGASYLPQLLPAPKDIRGLALLALSALFVISVIFTIGKTNYSLLNSAYAGVGRITPAQVRASDWMMSNLPKDMFVLDTGTLTYPKVRWMLALSHEFVQQSDKIPAVEQNATRVSYMLFDYSDYAVFGSQAAPQANQLKAYENSIAGNMSLLYDKDSIRIYSLSRG